MSIASHDKAPIGKNEIEQCGGVTNSSDRQSVRSPAAEKAVGVYWVIRWIVPWKPALWRIAEMPCGTAVRGRHY